MAKSFFITFEGPDGSGKSTQIELLKEYLSGKGLDVLLTREPGGNSISEKIRELILSRENSEMDPVTEMLLYAAARAQIVSQVIRPALEGGTTVICDRFVDSSVAYQGYGRNLGDKVMQVNEPALAGLMPDITFYMQLDPALGKARIDAGSFDRIEAEKLDFHERVAYGYDCIMEKEPDRVIPIDATKSIEEISSIIREYIDGMIGE